MPASASLVSVLRRPTLVAAAALPLLHAQAQAAGSQVTQASVWDECELLLRGAATTLLSPSGSPAVAALPSAAPDIWGRDIYVFFIFALAFFVANWFTRLVVIEPLTRALLPVRGAQVSKFAQSFAEAQIYGGFAIAGYFIVSSQEWSWPSAKWWIGFPEGGHLAMRSDLRCYYIAYAARYFQAAMSVLLEPRRKDFIEMNIHHWVTVLLCGISYIYGWNRIGCIVMFLLDPADVPLHAAKLCKYIADVTGSRFWTFMSDRIFESFAVVFFVSRLGMYPYVCWSAHIEATQYWPKGIPEWSCVVLLELLLLMQIFWGRLIVNVAIKMARGEHVEDVRSDDEDEADGPENKKTD